MNTHNDQTPNDYAAFIAIDWADQQHVFSLQVAGQTNQETGTLAQKPEVIGPWVAQLRERFGGRSVAIALEQSRGALIHALLSYDFIVIYPLHPTTVATALTRDFIVDRQATGALYTEAGVLVATKTVGCRAR